MSIKLEHDMTNTRKNVPKRILAEIHANNLTVISQRIKKHRVVTVANAQGATSIIVMAMTPSDPRSERNTIAQVRKTARLMAA
jgi:hypothetical protein